MPRRHLATENDRENILCLIKLYKKPNERSYSLKFLTPVMLILIASQWCQLLLLFIKLSVIFFYFLELFINITKDDGRSLFITMLFIHQMAPPYSA